MSVGIDSLVELIDWGKMSVPQNHVYLTHTRRKNYRRGILLTWTFVFGARLKVVYTTRAKIKMWQDVFLNEIHPPLMSGDVVRCT
jgi:hypothetical protein